ncbi:7 transmembrane sweet-taste receptor of 3 GCPR-domain-containing protein [Zopfochytrium polystomum]|nr:7 transmembrane sweet-taste receptor of 3 GCPR-domain-containing protein [Zopfochytrium polystomum]
MPWTEPDAAAVAAACAVLTLLILAAFVVLLLRSSHPIIKSMSPAFVAVILVGMMAINLMALSWIGDWTVWKCHLETFVLPLAFSLVMGAAFIKNYRLHKIFSNSYIMKGELSNSDLAWAVVVVVTPNLVLAITWTLVSPKHPHLNFVNLNNSQQSSYFVCASDSPKTDAIFLILLYTYNALLVAATAWIAFVTRNVRAHLSEAAFIGYSVYNAVATCVVLIPLTLAEVVTDFRVLFWFRSVALLFPVAFAFAMLFGKRVLYDVWVRRDDDRPGGSLTSSSSYGVATAPSEREQKRMAIDVLQRAAALSTLSCTLCILHKTGFTASWKRKIAIYQVQTGCLNLFDEASLVVGQSLNMNFFALMRETSDESTESYSLGFTELNGGGVDEKLSLAFESGSVFQAWAGAFRTAGDAKKAE